MTRTAIAIRHVQFEALGTFEDVLNEPGTNCDISMSRRKTSRRLPHWILTC